MTKIIDIKQNDRESRSLLVEALKDAAEETPIELRYRQPYPDYTISQLVYFAYLCNAERDNSRRTELSHRQTIITMQPEAHERMCLINPLIDKDPKKAAIQIRDMYLAGRKEDIDHDLVDSVAVYGNISALYGSKDLSDRGQVGVVSFQNLEAIRIL